VDTNQESCRHKPSQHVEVFATKSMTSPRQTRLCCSNGIWFVTVHGESPQQVPDKVADFSRTQIMKDGDVICVTDFYDLCLRLCRELVADFVAKSA